MALSICKAWAEHYLIQPWILSWEWVSVISSTLQMEAPRGNVTYSRAQRESVAEPGLALGEEFPAPRPVVRLPNHPSVSPCVYVYMDDGTAISVIPRVII